MANEQESNPDPRVYGGSDYQRGELFQPKDVLLWYEGCGSGTVAQVYSKNIIHNLHTVMASGIFTGERFADMCSGPSVHGVLSASKYFPQIYLTEYTPQCREYLQQWVDNREGAHNWDHYLQHVARLEGEGITPEGIASRVRKSVQAIIPCDLSKQEPLEEQWTKQMLPLDCILSSLTLEVAAPDRESHGHILSRIASYLRQGGGLILIGVLYQTWYFVGSTKFTTLSLDEEFVKSSVERAGFKVLDHHIYNINLDGLPKNEFSDAKKYFMLTAVKK